MSESKDVSAQVVVCEVCGKPTARGSMTQWIFNPNSRCTCTRVSETSDVLPRCPICGCRRSVNKGSLTQWIFQSTPCTCDVAVRAVDTATVPADSVIAGSPYEFIGIAGSGGVGTVYQAKSKKLQRLVAIKAINAVAMEFFDPTRFEREAKAISKLQHPNILSVIDFGSMIDGTPYLVTEWIDGCTLAQYLEQHGRLSVDATQQIFAAVLDGLSHAHSRDIIHRDIKPGNIMLSKTESGWIVKLIDFGTAKDIGNDQSRTRAEDMAMSPHYVSPEQVSGLHVDHLSDLYSLGCTMFEALTGRPPFVGRSIAVAMRHQTDAPPKLSDISQVAAYPEFLENIVAKLLEKRSEDRFRDAAEARASLLSGRVSASDVQSLSSEHQTLSESVFPRPVRSSTTIIGFCVVLALGLVGAIFLMLELNPKPAHKVSPHYMQKDLEFTTAEKDALNDFTVDVQKMNGENAVFVRALEGSISQERLLKRLGEIDVPFSAMEVLGVPVRASLFKQVRGHPIKGITFRDCSFADDAFAAMAEVKTIEWLRIDSEVLPDSVYWDLAKLPKLLDLQLTHCDVGLPQLERLSPLKRLERLDITWCPKIDGACLKLIAAKFPNLKELDIDRTSIKPQDLSVFANSKKLINISLAALDFDDDDIIALPLLPYIQSFTLSGNKNLTDKGLLSLAKFKQLVFIGARGTSVTDAGVEALKSKLKRCYVARGDMKPHW